MSYVRTLAICLLLVYFVGAAGCHCFDLSRKSSDCEIYVVLNRNIEMKITTDRLSVKYNLFNNR